MRISLRRTAAIALAAVLYGATAVNASEQLPALPQVRPIALTGATIHPVNGPDVESSTIVFENGKIIAVGRDAAIPSGAEVIDLAGKHIYPGFINANTVLGLTEISAVRSTIDIQEPGAVNPNARTGTSVNPDSELLPVARANGTLTAHVVPEGGLVSGQVLHYPLGRLDARRDDDSRLGRAASALARSKD